MAEIVQTKFRFSKGRLGGTSGHSGQRSVSSSLRAPWRQLRMDNRELAQVCELELVYSEARCRHAEIFGPGRQGGACGLAEHDDSGIEDFAPDIGRSPHAEEDEEVPVEIGDGAGCGAVDAESATREATEDASAGTAEVIAQPSRRELSYLRLLCSDCFASRQRRLAMVGLRGGTFSIARWQVCVCSII